MTRSEFLCIGPPKTGTSWLCVMFRELGVPMPPAKEIKYFTEEAYGLSDAALTRRVVGRHWLFRTNRRYLLGMLGNTLKRFSLGQQTDLPGLLWSINFVFGRRSDLWYQNLFNAYGGIGDISPKYCEISSSHVQAVDKRFPNLRIIMFLRDPIERDWSSARMNLCLRPGRDPKDIADSEYIDYFQRSTVTNQSSYNDIINRWESVFGNRFKAFFYDEIGAEPSRLLQEILEHVGIDNDTVNDAIDRRELDMGKKIGVGVKGVMPGAVRKFLINKHRAEIIKLRARFSDSQWPEKWSEMYGIVGC